MSHSVDALNRKKSADRYFQVVLGLYFALALTLVAETWWLDPPPGSLVSITLIQLIPLLIPLPWILKRQLRSVAWLCFILCFYFISAVLDAWFKPDQIHGWLATGLTVLLFIGSIMFIRCQAKAQAS